MFQTMFQDGDFFGRRILEIIGFDSVSYPHGERRYCTDQSVITWRICTTSAGTGLEPGDDEVVIADMYAITLMQDLILLRFAIHIDAIRAIEVLDIGGVSERHDFSMV